MRDLDYASSPERDELLSVFLLNELLAARGTEAPVLRLVLPAAEGADVRLSMPSQFTDVLGDRTRTVLGLEETLLAYLDAGGEVHVALGALNGRMDAAMLALAETLRGRSHRADVRPFEGLTHFAAVGAHAAIEVSMAPGVFRLDTSLFQYRAEASEVARLRDKFDRFFHHPGQQLEWEAIQQR